MTMLMGACGLLIGTTSAWARPRMLHGNAHIEAIIDFFVLMPALCLLIFLRNWSLPINRAIYAVSVQLGVLWVAHFVGMASVLKERWFDMFGVNVAFCLGSIAVLVNLCWVLRLCFPVKLRTTDCLGCGYSLIGLSRNVCPECGRAFTMHELGITEKDLIAQSPRRKASPENG